MTVNEELQKFREEFLLKHNVSCSTCELWEKNKKGKCASKCYCIVRDNVLNCAYKQRKETFRKDWRVFFDPETGETFTVSEAEYAVAMEEYYKAVERYRNMKQAEGIYITPVCELKGHRTWNYRFDEDYTEEIKKYESTHNKS